MPDHRQRWAVVVGVRHYGDFSRTGLRNLDSPVNDACRVFHVLTTHYGFVGKLLARPEDIQESARIAVPGSTRLESEACGLGSAQEIQDTLDWVGKQAVPEDLFCFFYSGHGSKDGLGYLVPFGAKYGDHSTYLMHETLAAALGKIRCRHKLLLFDCCYAGKAAASFEGVLSGDEKASELKQRTTVFCATDEFTVAPDHYLSFEQGGRRSAFSPFVEAFAAELERLSAGEALESSVLFQRVRDTVSQVLCPKPIPDELGRSVQIIPQAFPADGRGITLARRELRILVRPVFVLKQGETRSITLQAEGGTPAYEWSVEGTPTRAASVVGGQLFLTGDELGQHGFNVVATDRKGISARAMVTVNVIPPGQRPLQIMTTRFEPCFIGKDYRFWLEAEGGSGQFEWQVEGLPNGLTYSAYSWGPERPAGMVYGQVTKDFAQQTGRAWCHVSIILSDIETKDSTQKLLRLPLIDLDHYCEVPAGRFRAGYHPNKERVDVLARLKVRGDFEEHAKSIGFPARQPYLPRFFIKRFPVTHREWRHFVDAKKSVDADYHPGQPRRWSEPDFDLNREGDLPVTDISYHDMLAYCRWRGSRMPSGLEWEKAARGEDGRLFPWGDQFDANLCNNQELFWGKPTSVDQFPESVSQYGVFDMAGNVREYVRQHRELGHAWCPVWRGGSFADNVSELILCAGRLGDSKWQLRFDENAGSLRPVGKSRDPYVGFRDLIDVEDTPLEPQGFIRLDESLFKIPDSNDQIRTRPAFLARYAVSNQEYLEFIRSTKYSRCPGHWSTFWSAPFDHDDRYLPVVNVSYEDAKRFCEWKSRQLGVECRVMTRTLWRAAVHGPGIQRNGFSPRKFPWGQSFSFHHCNDKNNGWGGPMRVFDLHDGATSQGVFHLVGNVAQLVSDTQAVGGSWLKDCADLATWTEVVNGPQSHVGFRYYSEQTPARRENQ